MHRPPTDAPDLTRYADQLIHCPFCGQHEAEISEARFTMEDAAEEGWGQLVFWSVICSCGAVHGDYPGHTAPELAIAAWNTRHPAVRHG